MIWVQILVRCELQTLSYSTHKDLDQYLSRLLQNVWLKICDFRNLQKSSPKSEKSQVSDILEHSNQDMPVITQVFIFNWSALEIWVHLLFNARNLTSILRTAVHILRKYGWSNFVSKLQFSKNCSCSRHKISVICQKNKLESMCFRRSKCYLYWRTKTWIDLFEILLAHAEMRIAEISKEKYEFSKIMHFQSNILKQPWKILI